MKKQKRVLLQVTQLGHKILRKKAEQVINIRNIETQTLIDDLTATVMDVDGVGISAPQVYRSLRLFIMASHPNPRYPNAPKMKPTAIINPKILTHSKEKTKDWEGCLSVPGIRGLISRYSWVEVEYTTREEKSVKRKFKDFLARIFQHESDHLEGYLFVDRVESSKDFISEKEFQN